MDFLELHVIVHHTTAGRMTVITLPCSNATITRYDLSLRFFCIDATLLYEFESDKIWINEFE